MRKGRGAAAHEEQNGQEAHVAVPAARCASSWLPEIVSIHRYFAHCIHAYIICAPQGGSFLSSRPASPVPPAQSHPIPSSPISSRYSLSRSPAGAVCKPQASFLHQRPLPGKLLAAFLRGGHAQYATPPAGGQTKPAPGFFAPPQHVICWLAGGWPVAKCRAVVFLRVRCGRIKSIGPHIAKSSGKSRQAQGRRRRIFLALLPTQGAAYASRHV